MLYTWNFPSLHQHHTCLRRVIKNHHRSVLQNITTDSTLGSEDEVILRFDQQQQQQQQSPQDDGVNATTSNGVAMLILNRPRAANAMGRKMLTQLGDKISWLADATLGKDVRCVILTSVTPKVFSAGADLRERAQMSSWEASSFVTELRDTFEKLAQLPMPLIASVEGTALGGGLELALAADMIIAGKNSWFGFPETRLAILPGAGGTQRLSRKISPSRAKELIFTARRFNAETAFHYGIVEYIVDAGHADQKALELAFEICQNGPLAIRAAKAAIEKGLNSATMADALTIEKQCYESILPTLDRLEGLHAFREKRKPVYKGI